MPRFSIFKIHTARANQADSTVTTNSSVRHFLNRTANPKGIWRPVPAA